LPGMGGSTAAGLTSNEDVVRLLIVVGLALFCPLADATGAVPEHRAVRQDPDAYDELDPADREGFDEYFVVRTRTTARRYRDHVVPGTTLVDEEALGRIFSDWAVDLGSTSFSAPTLIVAGRRDATVGYVDAVGLLERYPHATLAVVEGAGHALMHERPELIAPLVHDWIDRARPHDA
jgi:pimeloyl-ACP methyl ester carboxylesterase